MIVQRVGHLHYDFATLSYDFFPVMKWKFVLTLWLNEYDLRRIISFVKTEKNYSDVESSDELFAFLGFFSLPLFLSASEIIHWSWPFVERNSSAAQASTASIMEASSLRMKFFVFDVFSAKI